MGGRGAGHVILASSVGDSSHCVCVCGGRGVLLVCGGGGCQCMYVGGGGGSRYCCLSLCRGGGWDSSHCVSVCGDGGGVLSVCGGGGGEGLVVMGRECYQCVVVVGQSMCVGA